VRHTKSLLAVVALLLCAAPVLPRQTASLLSSARYAVHANGMKIGEMTRTLTAVAPERYVLTSEVRATGLIALFRKHHLRERSEWIRDEHGYRPMEYYASYSDGRETEVERTTFDWEHNRVIVFEGGEITQLPLSDGLLDKLMYQMVIRDDLAAGKRELRYHIVDGDKIKEYVFEVLGEEEVVTPMGRVRAVKIRREDTVVWCAAVWDYLPVKLEQREQERTVASYILSLEQDGWSTTAAGP
jgi:hypothetical protein